MTAAARAAVGFTQPGTTQDGRAAADAGGRRAGPRQPAGQLSDAPQLPQNLAPGAAAVPHCVQWAAFGAATAVPQPEQNLAPGGLAV